ncbi:hypothetical protein Tco_1080398 [Tanacetum coccineum]|uniref:Uncharacterized protein n=1 Tax=Tanacetum coccineum TaxID=301880 RepID=A0ABQ5HWI9_9ASTR
MADHSQKWHDGTSRRNVEDNSSNNNGIVALIDKMDNLGRDMKKLKESIHAIQVGCQLCKGPHLDKDCHLKEGVKQIEEAKFGDYGRSSPFNNGRFHTGPLGYKNDSENTSLERLEAQIKHLTDELHSRASTSGQVKVEEVSIKPQLPLKEPNPGILTLACTIGNFNFYALADLGASGIRACSKKEASDDLLIMKAMLREFLVNYRYWTRNMGKRTQSVTFPDSLEDVMA